MSIDEALQIAIWVDTDPQMFDTEPARDTIRQR